MVDQGTGSAPQPKTPFEQIRERFQDLMRMTPATPEIMLAHLMKIVKDCEAKRADELKEAEKMERMAAASRAKAEGFATMTGIVYNVINSFVNGAQATAREEAERAEEEKREQEKIGEEIATKEVSPDNGETPHPDPAPEPQKVKVARATRSRRGKLPQ